MEGQEKVIAYASGDLSHTDYSQGVSCCCENEIHYGDADGLLARWLAKLQTYDFDMEQAWCST